MNVQQRVNELLEKDEIEKQRQLKEVEDFYRDIEEDLMVACLYKVEKDGVMNIRKAYFNFFSHENIESLLISTLHFTKMEIFKDNKYFVEKFTDVQLGKFYNLLKTSLRANGLEINREKSSYYQIDDFFRIQKVRPVIETIVEIKPIVKPNPPPSSNVPLAMFAVFCLVIFIAMIFGCLGK